MTMTMRERMLEVLYGGKPDRVPFVTYDNVAAPNAEIWSTIGRNQMGLVRWSKVHQLVHPDCRFESHPISRGGLRGISTVLYTPSGHLLQEKYFDPTFGSPSISKHFIESPDDYLVFREYLRNIRVAPDDETFIRDTYDLGDDGFPMVEITRTPYQQLWILWTSLLDLSLHFVDIPEIMEEVVALMADLQRRIFDNLESALDRLPIHYVNIPDNVTAPTIGPVNFRKYCLPLYQELVGRMKARGIPVVCHMDGDLRPLWDLIGESGIHGIDSFSPPPDNDTSVAEALSMWPDMRLLLNFPSSVHLAEPRTIYDKAKEILEQGGRSGHIWIQISENVPPGRWTTSFPQIVQAIDDFAKETHA